MCVSELPHACKTLCIWLFDLPLTLNSRFETMHIGLVNHDLANTLVCQILTSFSH